MMAARDGVQEKQGLCVYVYVCLHERISTGNRITMSGMRKFMRDMRDDAHIRGRSPRGVPKVVPVDHTLYARADGD